MHCKTCLLGLGVQLYIAIFSRSGTATRTVGDHIVYDEKSHFDVALKILAQILDKPCLPCFTHTEAWTGSRVSFSQKEKVEDAFSNKDCHFQGKCNRFKDICYPWNFSVIFGGIKYIIFSRKSMNTKDESYVNITCYDFCNSTSLSPCNGINGKQSKYNGSTAKPAIDLEKDNKRDAYLNCLNKKNKKNQTSQAKIPQRKYIRGKQPNCNDSTAKPAIDLNRENKRDAHSNAQDKSLTMDQASQIQYGLLLFTHLIAAVLGGGIICLVLFVKRRRKSRNKSTKKAGILNASYGRQESKSAITTNSKLFYAEEAVYHEVSDGMQTVSLENCSSPPSTRHASSSFPKHYKLPDIPQLPEEDAYHRLTSQHRKEVKESDDDNYDHAHGLDMMENDTLEADKSVRKEKGTLNIPINSSKEAFVEESMNNEYFILLKELK